MIAITSRQSYLEIQKDIPKMKRRVIDFLIDNPVSSNKEISVGTGLDINNVSGRVNELCSEGVVKFSERSKCGVTGRNVYKWEVSFG